MKHFLITLEIPVKAIWVKTTFTINCRKGMFGKKEINEAIKIAMTKINPEIEINGNANILFAMEITKKQLNYYENN